jgi:hypothetical protein
MARKLGTSDRAVRTHLSVCAFALGLRGGIFTTSIPHAGKHRVERVLEPYRRQVVRVGVRLVTRQI